MAEGGPLSDFFASEGGEHVESESAALALDPSAAAEAMLAARSDPSLAAAAATYFQKQQKLVEIQIEHAHEQRGLTVSQLKLRLFIDKLKAATQLFVVIAIGCAVICLLSMIYGAFTSREVVVNRFQTPPALVSRGLSGDVVASDILDALQKLQDATRGSTQGLNTKGAWASDIKIEVPETGVSIGELDRLLHERLGHDVHIDGDLVQSSDAGGSEKWALTIRGEGVPAETFRSAAADFDKIIQDAAEYIYGRSQPGRYATYLLEAGRNADALAFLPGAFARTDNDASRAQLANAWGNVYDGLNKAEPAAEKHRLALNLAPVYSALWWLAWSNLVTDVLAAQGERAGWRESAALLRAADGQPAPARPELGWLTNAALITWDLPLAHAAILADAAHNGGLGAASTIDGPQIADIAAMMHNPAEAARFMAGSDPTDPSTVAEARMLEAYAGLDRGDPAASIPPLEAFYKAWLADLNQQYTNSDAPCWLGLAYGLAGRMADAEQVFQRVGAWSRCYAFHGGVLAHAGDKTRAMQVWAEGLRLAPELPLIYLYRGEDEVASGDLRNAAGDFAAAHERAPHWADPLKAWGDLLESQGRSGDALARYDEALAYAPDWLALRQAREQAAKRRAD